MNKIIFIFILFITVFFMVTTAYLFNTNYHKFDLGHNIKYLNCEFDANIIDQSLAGVNKGSSQLIQEGGTGLIRQFYNMSLFSFLFGVLIMFISYNMKDKNKPIDHENLMDSSYKTYDMSKNGSSPKHNRIADDRRNRKQQEK